VRNSPKTASPGRADGRLGVRLFALNFPKLENCRVGKRSTGFLEANFSKAGFDRDRFAQLLKQSDIEARQIMVEFLAGADKESPTRLKALRATIEDLRNRSRELEKLSPPDAPAQFVFLDTASEIVGPSEMGVSSQHIEPWQNSFEFEWDVSGDDEAGRLQKPLAVGVMC
jgi:hypothetical protein